LPFETYPTLSGVLTKFDSSFSGGVRMFHVSGDYDYILKIVVKDMEASQGVFCEQTDHLQHIGSTKVL
jgi:Lrp/AsnC family leucine-responsive transcriptional regulator